MKRAPFILVMILLVVMTGCGEGNNQSADELVTVDVNTNYPEKELILQDFTDVEYIALESSDEFITQGIVKAVGTNILVVTNRNDGDIFLFDRKSGKGLRKINRFGQGAEEYSQSVHIILDEENSELLVHNYAARKILVYDLYGNFKRSFTFKDTDSTYNDLFNYDRENLICYKSSSSVDNESYSHLIVSKQDGSITREIQVPVKEIKSPVVREGELVIMPGFNTIVPYYDNWALVNTSSDSIYTYLPDGNIRPFIVRSPSIYSMDREIFLFVKALTDRYYFMQSMKKEVNFTTFKGFPTTDLVYDKQENALFRYKMYNDDYSNKKQFSWGTPGNREIITWQSLDAFSLVEAYEEGHLKGKLKDLAAGLDEESNAVIMLVKHKK